MTSVNRKRLLLLGGIPLLLFSLLLSLFGGAGSLSLADLLGALRNPQDAGSSMLVLRYARLPRALAGLLSGAALSASGLLLQEALSNDLASPGIIGINAGAGFFTLLAILAVPGSSGLRVAAAFLGAGLAAALVLGISHLAGSARFTILLTGVAVSSLFTAGINTITSFFPETAPDKAAFTIGGLQNISTLQLTYAFPPILIGILAALLLAPRIDLLRLGDEAAYGVGLNPRVLRAAAILLATLLASAAVTLSGLISFVGLIIPNIIRRRTDGIFPQILFCALYGASFLILCDTAARSLFYPYELPVGLLLSFLGCPFFLVVLVRRKRRIKL
ncbi:FecCD family ABC transporter permease [Clostridium vitabionis]|uniref:FecCD family ABC transporter permease n=1 Tax=Clostridium vitabionis TaxID=2784388 RepID=UPI00188BC8A0|nr:iron ABC transporter permease [Clostridium vitabionis]